MSSSLRLRVAFAALATSLALTGCFNGDGDDDDDDNGGGNTPPASASASSDGFIAYIASLADGMFDTAEPVDLENFSPPTDNVDDQPPEATSIDG